MVDINPVISIITLIVKSLNILTKIETVRINKLRLNYLYYLQQTHFKYEGIDT